MQRKASKPFFYITFTVLALAYACKKDRVRKIIGPVNTNRDSNSYSFLALGDSYTIGQSVAENERFPAQTASMLNAEGKHVSMPVYIATTGWTTIDLQNAIDQQNPEGSFDIVTLLIGVNDQHQTHDTTGYSARFNKLLQKAVQLAGDKSNHVFVLSIPDYSVTPFGRIDDTTMIRKQIDLFNSINLRVTNSYNISYTDITPVSREAFNDPSLIAKDSLHPSGKMYKKWAELLEPKVKEIFK